MIRDLIYPDDAQKVYDAFVKGLEYDAAFAILSNSIKTLPPLGEQPDFSTGIRFGGTEADMAVRQEALGLFSRFALLSMISRIEEFTRDLLLQRYVLEELKTTGQKMIGSKMWNILKKVAKDIRHNAVDQIVTNKILLRQPSLELLKQVSWLTGLNKVRNCLVHRRGIVQIEDVKERGVPIENLKDTDVLKTKWIRTKASVDGKEIKSFPYQTLNNAQLNITFEEYERSWNIGETIHITPLECQGIAQSLALLGSRVLSEFKIEMDQILGK
jgi:hypothetical protein